MKCIPLSGSYFIPSTPEMSNKAPKIKLKGDQKHKIGNIEENNAVGVLKLLQYVVKVGS